MPRAPTSRRQAGVVAALRGGRPVGRRRAERPIGHPRPVDPVPRASSLHLVAGSHAGEWYMPRSFLDDEATGFPDGTLAELPDSDGRPEASTVLAWDLEPGDAVFFHMLPLHAAGGVAGRRRVLPVRSLGDDFVHAPRRWATGSSQLSAPLPTPHRARQQRLVRFRRLRCVGRAPARHAPAGRHRLTGRDCGRGPEPPAPPRSTCGGDSSRKAAGRGSRDAPHAVGHESAGAQSRSLPRDRRIPAAARRDRGARRGPEVGCGSGGNLRAFSHVIDQ